MQIHADNGNAQAINPYSQQIKESQLSKPVMEAFVGLELADL